MSALVTHTFLYFLYSFFHLYVTRNRPSRIIRLHHTPHTLLYKCYAFSSFHYTLVGLTYYQFPLPSDYYQTFYPLFLCLQGGISFLSDVVYLERTCHWSQYVDRTFASYNMLMTLLVIRHCLNVTRPELVLVAMGIGIKKVDDYCFTKQYITAYMIFHILWHTILPMFGIYKAIALYY